MAIELDPKNLTDQQRAALRQLGLDVPDAHEEVKNHFRVLIHSAFQTSNGWRPNIEEIECDEVIIMGEGMIRLRNKPDDDDATSGHSLIVPQTSIIWIGTTWTKAEKLDKRDIVTKPTGQYL